MSTYRITPIFGIDIDNELVINRPEARRIKEYAALFKRCVAEVGDVENKKKRRAMRELMYIYLTRDPRSIYYVLPLSQRKIKAIEDINAPATFPIKEDDVLIAAIQRYEDDLLLHPTANAYLASERNLHSISEDINMIGKILQDLKATLLERSNKLEEDSNNHLTQTEVLTISKEIASIINEMIKLQMDSTKIIKDLPNVTKTVKELAAAYAEESGKNIEVVGGGQLNSRER